MDERLQCVVLDSEVTRPLLSVFGSGLVGAIAVLFGL